MAMLLASLSKSAVVQRWLKVLRILWLVVAIATGMLAVFFTQAAAVNYHWLFLFSLRIFVVHAALALSYFLMVQNRTRWLCLGVTLVALAGLGEFAVRLWS
jgi:hypothetical protein